MCNPSDRKPYILCVVTPTQSPISCVWLLRHKALYPVCGPSDRKPNILVSGDDDGQAYLVQPSSSDLSDWSYQQSVFLDVGTSTVGAIASADVDGDGYNEVFVPSFDEGLVYVFTFAP